MEEFATRVKQLRGALLRATAAAGVNSRDILTAPVADFRPITWHAPAIYPMEDVGGDSPTVFLSLNYAVRFHAATDLGELYRQVLHTLANGSPEEVLSEDGTFVKVAADACRLEKMEGRVVFSGPVRGAGGVVGSDAGWTFAMEFAAAVASSGLAQLIRSPNDLYAKGPGFEYGIKNGLPIGFEDVWTTDISSYVDTYQAMPRGCGWVTESLDAIDRFYFWAEVYSHEYPDLLPALEILPILRAGLTVDSIYGFEQMLLSNTGQRRLQRQQAQKKPEGLSPREYFQAVDSCIAIMADWRIPDQEKISKMVELLIPGVLSEVKFSSSIWNLNKPVMTLLMRDVKRIGATLDRLKNKRFSGV